MVSNPFSEGISVMIRGDATDLDDAVSSSKRSLGELMKETRLLRGGLAALGAAGFAVAANEARKFEQSMVELEKVTDPQTANRMSDAIRTMAEEIPVAQGALADIAADAGRFGIRGPKNIENFTRSVAKMAQATDLNTKDAGEALAKIATLTETPVSEVENLGSVINELSNNFATSSSEIVDNMMRSAGAMSQFGLSQKEIAGFAASLNAVSESSERAGTRIRRVVQELSNPKKIGDTARAMGMTKDQFEQMKKNDPSGVLIKLAKTMKKGGTGAKKLNQTLSTTSRQALSALGQNIDGVNRSLGMARKEFKRNTSLQKEFEKSTKTFNAQAKLMLNRLRNVGLTIGNKVLPHLTKLVQWISKGIAKFQKLNKRFDNVLGVAILLGPIVGFLATSFISLMSAISIPALTAAAASLAAIAGPAVIATAAIAGLFFAWKNNLFGIRQKTKQAVSFLQKWFGKAMTFLNKLKRIATIAFVRARMEIIKFGMKAKQIWKRDIEPLVTSTISTFNRIKKVITNALKFIQNNVIKPVLNWIRKEWNANGQRMVNEWLKTARQLMKWARKIADFIQNKVLGPFINWATREWGKFTSFLDRELRKAWNAIQPFINGALDALKRAFNGAMDFVSGAWREWNDELWQIVKFTFDALKGTVETGLDAIATAFTVVMRVLRLDFEGAWKSIKDFAERTLNGITNFVERWDIAGTIVSAFDSAGRAAGNALKGAFNAAMPSSVGIPSVTVAGQTFGGGSIRLPHLASGGFIEEGGLARLHAGEQVVPAADVAKRAPTGGGTVIKIENINASGRMEGRRAGMALADELRSHGFNS